MADMSDRTPAAHQDRPQPPLVVGLGASAGGIKALEGFFTHVPPHTGIAYVVILHLSPDHDSRLADVLQVTTRMPVTQVTQRTAIEPDHVYVISPNKTLEISGGYLAASDVTRVVQRRAPVDAFFRMLADSHGSRAVCVVLSGTGPNGSLGLKRVWEYGGLAIAQDPEEAEYGDMPRNSIATGLVDFILPVAQMPGKIAEYRDRVSRDDRTDAPARPAAPVEADDMREVLALLRVRTGHDFSSYKPATLQRRVERRMHIRAAGSLAGYAQTMREHPEEAVALMKELLISVTQFFRDPAAFEALVKGFIPRLFAARQSDDQVRVWVPGCATGEEAYTIAMLLAEHAALMAAPPSIQIFATDLDERAIATAREGFYTDAEVADVSEERLQRFFHRGTGGYRVQRDVREMLLFATHNVTKDPPFSHLDLISSRNLLIYLNRSIQDRVIETFHFALRSRGYLFLGSSESAEGAHDRFLTVDKDAHIYESRAVATRLPRPMAETAPVVPRTQARPSEPRPTDRLSPAELHQRLLEQYAPPSLVVTEDRSVVHMSERAGRFLHVPGGEPTRDLLRLARPELRPDLRAALHQAGQERSTVQVRGVRVTIDETERSVDIDVRPVPREGDPGRGFFLVIFHEDDAALEPAETAAQLTSEPITRHLEDELSRLKVQLRTTIEQYETQTEELKASNEELQAMNEELRSAAEELETSKEELQSVNEELTTVNEELKIKIEELWLANNDFQNLINSTDIGTIFLDRDLRVKMSTPAARDVFNLRSTDIGRPLSDITSHLRYEGLHDDVRQVLDRLETIDREVQTRDGRWHVTRLRPYRTIDNRIDGVVITFQDITDRRRAEMQVRESQERLKLLIDSAIDYAIFTITQDGHIDSWNAGAERMFGYRADEIVGSSLDVLFTPEDRAAGVPAEELSRAMRDGRASDERFHVRKSGARFYCSGVTTRLGTKEGMGFAKIARDLSSQLLVAAERNDAATLLRKLVRSQEEERARIARDLHDQLGQQITGLRLTLERHRDRAAAAGPIGDDMERALDITRQIDRELDFLSWEIRPAVLDDLGLAAALPRYVREWSDHYGVPAEFRSSAFEAGSLSSEAEVAFYRVAQEALNNVAKHAHATRVDVLLESREGSVVLVVEDDGVGFDQTDLKGRGIGLIGMNERAALIGATLQIETAAGRGTSIFLRCGTCERDREPVVR